MMKRYAILLAALAFALVLGMSITPAMAYFTDTHTANGGLKVTVTPSTDIYERYGNETKTVVITNAEEATTPVFVRVRADAPAALKMKVDGGNSWFQAGEWWYYGSSHDALTAVNPFDPDPSKANDPLNGKTSELLVKLDFPKERSNGKIIGYEYGDNFNVVVIYESVPATYGVDKEGKVITIADWNYQWSSGN